MLYALPSISQTHLTVTELKSRYPKARFKQVSPREYRSLKHRFLNGTAPVFLASQTALPQEKLSASAAKSESLKKSKIDTIQTGSLINDTVSQDTASDSLASDTAYGDSLLDSLALDSANRDTISRDTLSDSIAIQSSERDSIYHALEDSAMQGEPPPPPPDKSTIYMAEFVSDIAETGDDLDELAIIIYVAVGIIVVGAFIVTGAKVIYELIFEKKSFPIWRELGVSGIISGNTINDEESSSNLQGTDLASVHFSLGLQKKRLGIGISVEGGYASLRVRKNLKPDELFDANGFFFLFGPVMQFGNKEPFYLHLEFLNGTSSQTSIKWISKATVSARTKVSQNVFLGLQVGALYVRLSQLDGLLIKSWEINDEFSLLLGLEGGYGF
jgi:hypothetical protein